MESNLKTENPANPPENAPETVDLTKVVEQSAAEIRAADQAPPLKRKRGPYKKRTQLGAPQGSPQEPSVTPGQTSAPAGPSPMVPMLAQGHKVFFKGMAKAMRRSQFDLPDGDAQALGVQLDVVLKFYLPDVEKNPKKAALYTYLATVVMVGAGIMQTPSDPKPEKKIEKPDAPEKPSSFAVSPMEHYRQPHV